MNEPIGSCPESAGPLILFAMLRDGTFYESRTPTVTLAA